MAIAKDNGKEVASIEGKTNKSFYIPVKSPLVWSPDDPFLYDLTLELRDNNENILDRVDSYFGMRSVTLEKINGVIRPLLNGEFVFNIGLLDQRYWPDGILTAPSEDALRYDIEVAKKAGFNAIRKHIKVEPQR